MPLDEIGRQIRSGALVDGRKVVDTAATSEALSSSSIDAQWLIITAETNNTGVMAVGASTVIAAEATRRGIPLYAGESITLYQVDLANVYLDTTVSGDGVTFIYKT